MQILTLQPRLALNSWRAPYFSLQSAGIIGYTTMSSFTACWLILCFIHYKYTFHSIISPLHILLAPLYCWHQNQIYEDNIQDLLTDRQGEEVLTIFA